jgi:hypothetical protein
MKQKPDEEKAFFPADVFPFLIKIAFSVILSSKSLRSVLPRKIETQKKT